MLINIRGEIDCVAVKSFDLYGEGLFYNYPLRPLYPPNVKTLQWNIFGFSFL